MTVSVTNPIAGPFTPNSATTEFPFAFKVGSVGEIAVVQIVDDIETTINSALYSIILDATEGGTVVFTDAPEIGSGSLYIHAAPDFTQDGSFTAEGNFSPRTLNTLFDRSAIRDIYLKARIDKLLPEGALIPGAGAGKFVGLDVNGDPIFLSGTGTDLALRDDLVAATGGDLVGTQQAETGAKLRSAREKLGDILDVRDFVGSNAVALASALNALSGRGGGDLHLEPGAIYDLGTFTTPVSVIILQALRGVTIRGNGATIRAHSTAALVNLFYFVDCQRIRIENLTVEDTAPNFSSGSKGVKGFVFDANNSVGNSQIVFDNVLCKGMNTMICCEGDPPYKRVSGIHIVPNCRAENTFYGLSCQENGDNISGGFTTYNCGRSYFPYGCTGHDLKIRVEADGDSIVVDTACLIKRYANNTTNLKLDLTFAGSVDHCTNLVALEHQNDSGAASIIDDIDINYRIEQGTTDTNGAPRLLLRSYTAAGAENVGSSAHISSSVRVSGQMGRSANAHIKARYTPATAGVVAIDCSLGGLSLTKTVDAPGFLIRTAPGVYVFEKFGDLTSGAISVPMIPLDGTVALFEIDIAAEKTSVAATSGASTKMHRYCDTVGVELIGGTSAIITGSPIAGIPATAFNSSNLTRSYAGSASGTLDITLAGSDYAVSTAYARVTLRCLNRPLAR